jgi:hypothetical protein
MTPLAEESEKEGLEVKRDVSLLTSLSGLKTEKERLGVIWNTGVV